MKKKNHPEKSVRLLGRRRVAAMLASAVVLVLMVVAIRQYATKRSRKNECREQLEGIGQALQDYRDCFGCFPPAIVFDENGKPMHSWRVLIVPFLEKASLYDFYSFSEPWDGAHNQLLNDVYVIPDDGSGRSADVTSVRRWYRCPGAPVSQDGRRTNYFMIVDPDEPLVDLTQEVFFARSRPGLKAQFPAGGIIMVVEIAKSDVHWLEPRDLSLRHMSFVINDPSKPSISSWHVGGAFVITKDGTVEFLSDETTQDRLRAMLRGKRFRKQGERVVNGTVVTEGGGRPPE